jgi:hypothetical protein
VLRNAFSINGYAGCILVYVIFAAWAVLTLSILGKEGGGGLGYLLSVLRIRDLGLFYPGSGIRNRFFSGPIFFMLNDKFVSKRYYNS